MDIINKPAIDFLADYIWRIARVNLRALRLKHSYTLIDIKDILNHKSLTTISRFERGEGRLGMEDIYILCALYQIQMNDIFPSTDDVQMKFNLQGTTKKPNSKINVKKWNEGNATLIDAIGKHLKKKKI